MDENLRPSTDKYFKIWPKFRYHNQKKIFARNKISIQILKIEK